MNNCNIVRDLLPLYREGLLSEDSISFVENHLIECDDCKKLLNDDFEILKTQESSLEFLKEEIKKEKKKYGLSILFSCISLFIILLFYLTKPIHFEDDGNLFKVNNIGEKVVLTFSEKVLNVEVEEDDENIFVSANTTVLDKIFKKSNRITVELNGNKEIYYSNHKKNATKINFFSNGGAVELPRLVLRNFLSFLCIFSGTLGIYLFSFSKKLDKKWKFRIFTIPISFILAYITITGLDGATYYLKRDFLYIILLGFCYYITLNSIYNIKNSKI